VRSGAEDPNDVPIRESRSPAHSPSLSQTIGVFCRDMVRLRHQLQEAQGEIRRLQKELGLKKGPGRVPSIIGEVNLRSLRRQLSFHCHPDRGGDERLMKRVNALFDHLEAECVGVGPVSPGVQPQ
jgi:hypothetical protein